MDVVPMTPYSTVKLLSNVPLDNSYKDTLDFSSVSSQYTYFNGKTKFTYSNCTPVKIQNAIRLPLPADKIYDCNYLMFQNANFDSPQSWFYAFITKIEYINMNMCHVFFEIDVMQTWQFKYTIKPSYVEREHSTTDVVGDNLVHETVDFGQYREEVLEITPWFDSYTAVIAGSYDPTIPKLGGYVGGMFTGLRYLGFSVDSPEGVQLLIDYLDLLTQANKIDSIASIFMIPTKFFTDDTTPVQDRFDAMKRNTKIGAYTPRNKKILTHPYNFLYVCTADGNSAIYRYELFLNPDSCGFKIACAMSCNPEITLEPIGYNNQSFNVDESLTMTGFPQCSYSIDTFKAYLAQNATGSALNAIGSIGAIGAGVAMGNPTAVMGGVLGLGNQINQIAMTSTKPPQSRGQQGNSTFTGTREKNFYFINKHISEEYARILDDYFDMFGYATHRVKVPNTKSRTYWNYVKTIDSKIVGTIPFNDIAKIRSIFDNGVTFWHGDYVGDYTRNNDI